MARRLFVVFADDASDTIPVSDDFEMPELDEIDVAPHMWLCVDTPDGGEVGFPLHTVRRYRLSGDND